MKRACGGRRIHWLRASLLVAAVFGLLCLPLLFSLQQLAWQLNLVARTEVVRVQLMDTQSWHLSDAVVCVRADKDTARPQGVTDPVCGGRQWKRLQTPGDPMRRGLRLVASPDTPIDVQLEMSRSGELRMALRRVNTAQSLGSLDSRDTGLTINTLGDRVNVIWPALTLEQAVAQEDGGVAVLPFSGSITVGRDVSWGTQKMLIAGEIAVFSASEDRLAGRTVAEQSVLMLGDRVDISASDHPMGMPKGFLRVNRLTVSSEDASAMDVIVYAPAEQTTIHRYGGGDYQFEASWWVRLKHQSSLVILLLMLTGLLSVLSSLINIVPGCRKVFAWCRQDSPKPDVAIKDNASGSGVVSSE